MTALKVCCIQSVDEAKRAAEAGATFVGLVGAMPSGPGSIPDDRIAAIAGGAPSGVTTVLLTAQCTASSIAEHVRATGVSAVQIVRWVPAAVRRELRAMVPGIEILQVVHVLGAEAVSEAEVAADGSDYVLLDSGRPTAAVPELGGTGRIHDWSVSAEIVSRASIPIFLAGGLTPANLAEAVAAVRPFGVDVCSGLRGPAGCLDEVLLTAFVEALDG